MSRGKIIAVANMKGGVGKTTTVVMLAEALAALEADTRKGQPTRMNRVLVIDLDAQSSASYCIAGDEHFTTMIQRGRTIDAYVQEELLSGNKDALVKRVQKQVSETRFMGEALDISLIACGVGLRRTERQLMIALNSQGFSLEDGERHVWDAMLPDIDTLRGHYDYILFDCAPGISMMTDIGIRAADIVIATTMPDYLCRYGLEMFVRTTWLDPSSLPRPKRIPYVLITRFQANIRQHRNVLEQLECEAGLPDRHWQIFQTRIPVSAHLAQTLEPTDEWPTLAGRYRHLLKDVVSPLVQELKGYLRDA
jgi:chromosome partitioning protein